MELNNIIIKPYHTEKSYGLRKFQDPSCLSFVVNKKANKIEIKKAFQALYNVVPEKINILVRKPKKLRYTTNGVGYSKEFKIAFITLPKGVQVALTKDEIEEANNANNKDQGSSKKQDAANVKNEERKIEEKQEKKVSTAAKKDAKEKKTSKK